MSPTMHNNVLSWATNLDPNTMAQAQLVASMDEIVPGHVALMADAHVGMGSTIGSVIPTLGAVIPSTVGVDLGCGMISVETGFSFTDLPDDLTQLHERIATVVPAGVGQGHKTANVRAAALIKDPRVNLDQKMTNAAEQQLGSLGAGNHFVEVCLDERDRVWVVLHSGSRGVGNQLAQKHIKAAKAIMVRDAVELPDPNLAYLTEGTEAFDEYIGAMLWAQDWALANREVMMEAVLGQFSTFMGVPIVASTRINVHHNFCEKETHGDQELWITRKGAVRARKGKLLIIPGSMGTKTYIAEGLGNPESYESSSHGAGRRMSRTQARKQLDVEGFREQMAGKVWNAADAVKLLDEDPRSYKDIDQVMEDQRDLVKVLHTLRQIINYKGL